MREGTFRQSFFLIVHGLGALAFKSKFESWVISERMSKLHSTFKPKSVHDQIFLVKTRFPSLGHRMPEQNWLNRSRQYDAQSSREEVATFSACSEAPENFWSCRKFQFPNTIIRDLLCSLRTTRMDCAQSAFPINFRSECSLLYLQMVTTAASNPCQYLEGSCWWAE